MEKTENEYILDINGLEVSFDTYLGKVKAVRNISLKVKKGETLAIVGESGSGKTVTAKSINQLFTKKEASYDAGSILFEGENLLEYSAKDMEEIRGKHIGMVMQDPMVSLDPTMVVGTQIAEGIRKHLKFSKKEAMQKSIELLEKVGIPNPKERAKQYPHQFSGGMRQRVCLAIALASNPELLIADEPTTALDVTIQAQVLELINALQDELNTSIILITHDLGIVANTADQVAIMYAGKIVEQGNCDEIFYHPMHPYTWGLLQSIPSVDQKNKEYLPNIPGMPPALNHEIIGCPFKERCQYAMEVCYEKEPDVYGDVDGHRADCWLYHEFAPQVENPITGKGVR